LELINHLPAAATAPHQASNQQVFHLFIVPPSKYATFPILHSSLLCLCSK